MATKQQVAEVMAVLSLAYPQSEVTTQMVDLYAEMWVHIPSSELSKLAKQHMVEEKWFPKIADITTAWAKAEKWAGFDMLTPEGAWCLIKDQIRHHGLEEPKGWPHPDLANAVQVMGWKSLCDMTSENSSILRAQFFKTYATFVERAEQELLRGSVDPKAQGLIDGVTESLIDGEE